MTNEIETPTEELAEAGIVYPPFKLVHIFDAATGEYLYDENAQLSPEDDDGTYLMPVTSTDVAPLPAKQGQAVCFNVPTKVWNYIPDFRGQTFFDQTTGAPAVITTLTVPTNLAATLPASLALAKAKVDQLTTLKAAYFTAIQTNVPYTSKGGVAQVYQADASSQNTLATELAVYGAKGVTPTDYFWVAADNAQVPFTLADLQGLTGAMGDQGWTAFKNWQVKKSAVPNAKTIADVLAVTW